jgi:hypothetical protein
MGGAFITSLLLTANLEHAENAMLDAIDFLDPENESEGALLRGAVQASLAASVAVPSSRVEAQRACTIVPSELCKVLHLAPYLRHCFVLRVLLGWSREVCALLLGLRNEQIEERTSAALLALASSAAPLRMRTATS